MMDSNTAAKALSDAYQRLDEVGACLRLIDRAHTHDARAWALIAHRSGRMLKVSVTDRNGTPLTESVTTENGYLTQCIERGSSMIPAYRITADFERTRRERDAAASEFLDSRHTVTSAIPVVAVT